MEHPHSQGAPTTRNAFSHCRCWPASAVNSFSIELNFSDRTFAFSSMMRLCFNTLADFKFKIANNASTSVYPPSTAHVERIEYSMHTQMCVYVCVTDTHILPYVSHTTMYTLLYAKPLTYSRIRNVLAE